MSLRTVIKIFSCACGLTFLLNFPALAELNIREKDTDWKGTLSCEGGRKVKEIFSVQIRGGNVSVNGNERLPLDLSEYVLVKEARLGEKSYKDKILLKLQVSAIGGKREKINVYLNPSSGNFDYVGRGSGKKVECKVSLNNVATAEELDAEKQRIEQKVRQRPEEAHIAIEAEKKRLKKYDSVWKGEAECGDCRGGCGGEFVKPANFSIKDGKLVYTLQGMGLSDGDTMRLDEELLAENGKVHLSGTYGPKQKPISFKGIFSDTNMKLMGTAGPRNCTVSVQNIYPSIKLEEARIVAEAQKKRLAEEARLAAKAEQARIAAEAKAEKARIAAEAEKKHKAEKTRLDAKAKAQKSEEARLVAEAGQKKKEEQAQIVAEAEAKRKAEKSRLAAQAEQQRSDEEAARIAAEAEVKRKAMEARLPAKAEKKDREEQLAQKEAELQKKMDDLERREAELALKQREAELNRKETELAQKEAQLKLRAEPNKVAASAPNDGAKEKKLATEVETRRNINEARLTAEHNGLVAGEYDHFDVSVLRNGDLIDNENFMIGKWGLGGSGYSCEANQASYYTPQFYVSPPDLLHKGWVVRPVEYEIYSSFVRVIHYNLDDTKMSFDAAPYQGNRNANYYLSTTSSKGLVILDYPTKPGANRCPQM